MKNGPVNQQNTRRSVAETDSRFLFRIVLDKVARRPDIQAMILPDGHTESSGKSCNETISQKGFRFTAQRREVYDALLVKRDHPTAVDVFLRVQKKLSGHLAGDRL